MAVCGKGLQQRTTGWNVFVVLPGMEEENLGYDIGMQGRQLYECAIMDTVVVLPEYRGMHLQYEMMQTAERKASQRGLSLSSLYGSSGK